MSVREVPGLWAVTVLAALVVAAGCASESAPGDDTRAPVNPPQSGAEEFDPSEASTCDDLIQIQLAAIQSFLDVVGAMSVEDLNQFRSDTVLGRGPVGAPLRKLGAPAPGHVVVPTRAGVGRRKQRDRAQA